MGQDMVRNPAMRLKDFLLSRAGELQKVIPASSGMKIERIVNIVIGSTQRTPRLLECDMTSLYKAVNEAVQFGFEPNGPLGHAYLVPFFNSKTGTYNCNMILGYRGLVDLGRRSGSLIAIFAETVHRDEVCEVMMGLDPNIIHKPRFDIEKNQGNMILAYAVAHLRDGGKQFVAMSKFEIDAIRNRSKSKGDGPWVTDYLEMSKKTAVRRLCKLIPMSLEAKEALDREDEIDTLDLKDVTPTEQQDGVEGAKERLKKSLTAPPVNELDQINVATKKAEEYVPTSKLQAELDEAEKNPLDSDTLSKHTPPAQQSASTAVATEVPKRTRTKKVEQPSEPAPEPEEKKQTLKSTPEPHGPDCSCPNCAPNRGKPMEPARSAQPVATQQPSAQKRSDMCAAAKLYFGQQDDAERATRLNKLFVVLTEKQQSIILDNYNFKSPSDFQKLPIIQQRNMLFEICEMLED